MVGLYAFSTWYSLSIPSIYLTLTLNLNSSQHVVSLSTILEVQNTRQINSREVLLEMTTAVGNIPSNDYSGTNALKATNNNSILLLAFNNIDNRMRY